MCVELMVTIMFWYLHLRFIISFMFVCIGLLVLTRLESKSGQIAMLPNPELRPFFYNSIFLAIATSMRPTD